MIQNTTIQNLYGRHSYGSTTFGSGAQIPADVTIQSITIRDTSCKNGCTIACTTSCPAIVDIVVVWTNSGGSAGTFTPWVTIGEGDPIIGTPITVVPGEIGTTTFSSVSLPRGVSHVCFDIDMNT